MTKNKLTFNFGYNVKPKTAPKKAKQTKSTRQAFALARGKGGPLHGHGGS